MKEPAQTCPAIDDAQREIRNNAEALREIANELEGGRYARQDIIATLEDLRAQNCELREWGQHWKDRADELEAELSEMEQLA